MTRKRVALTALDVLFVGKYENDGVLHLSVVDDFVKFAARFVNALAVGAVDDKDKPLRAGVVVAPERSNLVLAADIPDVELDVLV